jgi:F-type H+-transporting ATPase subunit delta
MTQPASREALADLRERLDAVTGRFSTADGLSAFADELYQVAELLDAQPRLRRVLGDPSTPPEGRVDFATRLLDGKVGASALAVVKEAVALRWSSPWDLVNALEHLADDGQLAAAEQNNTLDEVEDELFRFERVLDSDSRLVTLLDDVAVPAPRRIALLDELVAAKVSPITRELLAHAVASKRRYGVERSIDALLDIAAKRRDRSVARVISAVELTAQQQTKLAAALAELYGRSISVRTAVDPAVQGGLIIRVGDEVIDGSVSSQLAAARAALAQ